MPQLNRKTLWVLVLGGAAVGVLLFVWQALYKDRQANGLASGNGRIEAVEIDIATKTPGRIKEILVDEGDFVTSGQVLARMDTVVLEAQLREARALLRQAENSHETARIRVAQRQSERDALLAKVGQRRAEADVAKKRLERSEALVKEHAVSHQEVDDDRAGSLGADAVLRAAEADVVAAEVAIATAKSLVTGAQSEIEAVQAKIERLQADLDDSVLKAPRDGRVQYRVAQLGEVVGAGGRVLSLVDLSDVYMTFFLPAAAAGNVALGTEVRLVLDAAPQYVVPAQVSFVADVAQFTPKTVETASEREKLMFRVKAQLPRDLLKKHITSVKTGLPGMAYVRLDANTPWPDKLKITLPQ